MFMSVVNVWPMRMGMDKFSVCMFMRVRFLKFAMMFVYMVRISMDMRVSMVYRFMNVKM